MFCRLMKNEQDLMVYLQLLVFKLKNDVTKTLEILKNVTIIFIVLFGVVLLLKPTGFDPGVLALPSAYAVSCLWNFLLLF